MTHPFTHAYQHTYEQWKCCPIETGLIGKLADNECAHGRLPHDRTPRCGCWPEEGPVLQVLEGQAVHYQQMTLRVVA